MGLQIGQAVEELRVPRQNRATGGAPRFDRLVREQTDNSARVGFGDGTVSMPGQTIRALDRNFEGARRLVETLEEARQRVRERLTRQRAKADDEPREPVLKREEAAATREERQIAVAAPRTQERTRSMQALQTPVFQPVNSGETRAAQHASIRVGERTLPKRIPDVQNVLDILA